MLRRLNEDDWPLWRWLRRASLEDAPSAFGSTLAQWSGDGDREQRWRARLRDVALHLVVEVAGAPVGVVAASAPGGSAAGAGAPGAGSPAVSAPAAGEAAEVELISLWVAPAARGGGIGDLLVEGVLGWAAREHPDALVGLSVAAGNPAARRLYERHGFVDTGPSPDEGCERRMQRPAGARPT